MPSEYYPVDTIFLGCIYIETIINRNQEAFIGQPGGNLLYSSFAHKKWGKNAGLVSKINYDIPESWISDFNEYGFDTRGIIRIAHGKDSRKFYCVSEDGDIIKTNPKRSFLNIGQPFPRELLGYSFNEKEHESRKFIKEMSLTEDDIPENLLDCHNLALCPMDFFTHSIIPSAFRAVNSGRVFIHASNVYMHPSFLSDIPQLSQGSTLFFSSEINLINLFLGKSKNLWEIAELISSFGVENVVISKSGEGFLLYSQPNNHRCLIPNYPVETIDPIGMDDAFFGGFIAGYTKSFDPVRSAAMGSVSASIKAQGTSAKYLFDSLPELSTGRMEYLLEEIQTI